MKTLEELRQKLDGIDTQIAKLLDQRMEITDQVAEYKNTHNLPLTDSKREINIIQNIKQHISNTILKETVEDIYQVIFATSKTTRSFIKHETLPFKKIAIIGLGLMGGSIAKALKAKDPNVEIYTIARQSENTQMAIEQGYINATFENWQELIEQVELVILATSIDSIPTLADEIAKSHAELVTRHSEESVSHPELVSGSQHKTLVLDIASVKEHITSLFHEKTTETLEFLPTHPMGGSDKVGFEHAKATLFINRPWILTPHEKNTNESIEKVQQLIQFMGSKPLTLAANKHDEYAAIVSHLVFIISTYLFAFPNEKHHHALEIAGAGFESTTRLASGSAKMHEHIVRNNERHIQKAIEEFIEFLQNNPLTKDTIREFFEKNKQMRDEFVGK